MHIQSNSRSSRRFWNNVGRLSKILCCWTIMGGPTYSSASERSLEHEKLLANIFTSIHMQKSSRRLERIMVERCQMLLCQCGNRFLSYLVSAIFCLCYLSIRIDGTNSASAKRFGTGRRVVQSSPASIFVQEMKHPHGLKLEEDSQQSLRMMLEGYQILLGL